MSLFFMILRKMLQNKWLVSTLFLGTLMTVGLVSTIPIYSEGILSRMLVKDLEAFQNETNAYPGAHLTKLSFQNESTKKRQERIVKLNEFMKETGKNGFGIPVKNLVVELQTASLQVIPKGIDADSIDRKQITSVKSVSQFEDHIVLVDGKMPAEEPVNGVYEVLVNNKIMSNLDVVLGTELQLFNTKGKVVAEVKPVGMFEKKQVDDPYFRSPQLENYDLSFVVPERTFERYFMVNDEIKVSSAWWYFVLDYSRMELRNLGDFLSTSQKIKEEAISATSRFQVDSTVPIEDKIQEYFNRSKRLSNFMWSLNVPVLIMLGFYMFMVSNLIVDRQKNEIAVIRSRGASRLQIMASYGVEAAILCSIAWAVGPFLGLLLTKMLGASNGFLEFVQRSSLPLYINAQSYQFGALAAITVFLMILTPVFFATRVSIVGHKQGQARIKKLPFWHKMYLDVLLLGISIYGYYAFKKRLAEMKNLGLSFNDLQIDPLQFVVPALFIVGGGLLILRLYPLILRIIYRAGSKIWTPGWYATLIQVGRSSNQYQFLMIFFVITIATGVFSAGAARTINNNTEERILYSGGSDIVIKSEWPSNKPVVVSSPGAAGPSQPSSSNGDAPTLKVIQYHEPPFEPYMKLPGVEDIAKVFVKEEATFQVGDSQGSAVLMGIDTDDFGRTAWFQNLLLRNPLNEHLNLIASDSRAVIISRTLADQKKVKVGDTIWVGWEGVDHQPFIVYSVVDYFPTFNPNPQNKDKEIPMLIVGNLSRIQLQLGLEPYQIWLKMRPDSTTAELYDAIKLAKLDIINIHNTREELVKAKNDPFLMALNGMLTLGFLSSIFITFVGFLLYWVLSLRGRALQNGVMRALGLSLRQLIGMLAIEQLLTSGVAVMIGIVIGNVTGRMFVPNFQIAFNPSLLVPPFRVVFESVDFMRLYIVIGIMLSIGLAILGYMLSRTRIHQALKLGED